eukprot:566128-Rhodomonas_salina.2
MEGGAQRRRGSVRLCATSRRKLCPRRDVNTRKKEYSRQPSAECHPAMLCKRATEHRLSMLCARVAERSPSTR